MTMDKNTYFKKRMEPWFCVITVFNRFFDRLKEVYERWVGFEQLFGLKIENKND